MSYPVSPFRCFYFDGKGQRLPPPFSRELVFFFWASSIQVVYGTVEQPSRPSVCEPWEIVCEDLGLDDETWAVISKCWDQEPEKRPIAKEVVTLLRAKLGPSRPKDESRNTIPKNLPRNILEPIPSPIARTPYLNAPQYVVPIQLAGEGMALLDRPSSATSEQFNKENASLQSKYWPSRLLP